MTKRKSFFWESETNLGTLQKFSPYTGVVWWPRGAIAIFKNKKLKKEKKNKNENKNKSKNENEKQKRKWKQRQKWKRKWK